MKTSVNLGLIRSGMLQMTGMGTGECLARSEVKEK